MAVAKAWTLRGAAPQSQRTLAATSQKNPGWSLERLSAEKRIEVYILSPIASVVALGRGQNKWQKMPQVKASPYANKVWTRAKCSRDVLNMCMHTNLFITRSCISGDRDKSNAEYLQRKNDVWAPTQTKLHGLKIRAHSDPKLKKRRFFYPISVAAAASSPKLICNALSQAPLKYNA